MCVCTENARVKLKELLASLGGLVMSDADVVSVVSLLRDKSPNALDSWYKVRKETMFSPYCVLHFDTFYNNLMVLVSSFLSLVCN